MPLEIESVKLVVSLYSLFNNPNLPSPTLDFTKLNSIYNFACGFILEWMYKMKLQNQINRSQD